MKDKSWKMKLMLSKGDTMAVDIMGDVNEHTKRALVRMLQGVENDGPAWVSLTAEEIGLLTTGEEWSHLETPALALFARAIEAKLMEKNT